MAVQQPDAACCAAKMLQIFFEGPRPSPTSNILVRQTEAYSENFSATDIEVDSRGSPLRGYSIGDSIVIAQHSKIVGGKNVEKSTFFN